MCDCYEQRCETCDKMMSIHIADFCTDRTNVHPYCPKCTKILLLGGETSFGCKVFPDIITRGGKYGQVEGEKKGQIVLILCYDMKAHGIRLN